MTKYEVEILKRNEHIGDVIMQLKNPITNMVMDLWTKVYKDENIPKTKWLSQFQLSLKTIKSLDDDSILAYLTHKKRLLTSLHSALMLTAYIHHNEASPNIVKDGLLVVKFTRDSALLTARELWTKPYLVYNITHKKNQVQNAKDDLERIIALAIKYEIRELVDNIITIENERLKQCQDLVVSVAASSIDEDSESTISSLSSDTSHTNISPYIDNKGLDTHTLPYEKADDSMSIKSVEFTSENNEHQDNEILSGNQSPRSTLGPLDMDYIPRKEASPRTSSETMQKKSEQSSDIVNDKTFDIVDDTPVEATSRKVPIVIEKSHKKKQHRFVSALDKYSEYREHHSLAASSLIGNPKQGKKATFF